MARRTHSEIVKEYAKEYDRIRKQIERMEKRGYDVTGLKPERIAKKDIKAKDLEKLKNLTNEKIYRLAKGGEEKRKEEKSEAARKGWETRRSPKPGKPEEPPTPPVVPPKREPKTPKPPKEPKAPTPKKPPVPPGTPAGEGPGEDGLTDEEEAALQRFDELFDSFIAAVRRQVQEWKANTIRRTGSLKKFASMLVDALNGGLVLQWVPPSQQEMYAQMVMQTINAYLPPDMSEEDRKETEDEWQDLIDNIADDEDFPFF